MAVFSGTYTAKLDRGRCFFPAQFRKELGDVAAVRLKIRPTENDNKYLEIYTEDGWLERTEAYKKFIKYKEFDYGNEEEPGTADYYAEFISGVDEIIIELKSETNPTNVGRMVIPKEMTKTIKLQDEVVFRGVGGLIQVWAKETYDKRPTLNQKAFLAERIKEQKQQNL
ncbi:hypothetical protein FACS18945_4600 [Bacteroidia bacterium]|nr:hypothetical protein FACS18945_4600 [Bacteroidia bacterium]